MKRRRPGPKSRSVIGPSRPGRRTLPASEFKARCLRVLDEVASGHEVLVTKRGQEVALVVPARRPRKKSSRGAWKGLVRVNGEIVHSDWSSEFDAAR